MPQIVENLSRELKYYDTQRNELLSPSEIQFSGKITNVDFEACVKNGLSVFRQPGEYYSINNVFPIPERSRWVLSGGAIKFHSSIGRFGFNPSTKFERLDSLAKKYVNLLQGKTVAIELSGGLDTALIIEFLKRNNVDIALIECIGDYYEFRTERAIQKYYLDTTRAKSISINYSDCPAFGSLLNTPLHPFPTADSLYYLRHSKVAEATIELGSNILLNGNAGDSVLGHGFSNLSANQVPIGYDKWSLTDTWTESMIFKPLGISYISVFSIDSVVRTLIALRRKEDLDVMKLWSRKKFENILPSMLSKYAYKASHDSWVSEGLKIAATDINLMSKISLDITGNEHLSPQNVLPIANNYFFASESDRRNFLIKLSFMVWLYGFYREGLLH